MIQLMMLFVYLIFDFFLVNMLILANAVPLVL